MIAEIGVDRMATVQTKLYEYGQTEIDYLSEVDEILGNAMKRIGRVDRVIIPDIFTALVHAIVGQLISVKSVNTIWERMQTRLGEITPHNIALQHIEDIQKCGITMKKASYIKDISNAVVQGSINLEDVHQLSDKEVITMLTKFNGVGKWTAEMILMNAMERPNIVSWGDIAIRRGMMKLYGLQMISEDQFGLYQRRYSPFGSVASIYLWQISVE